MDTICGLTGISRQAHYQQLWRDQAKSKDQMIVLELVRQIRRKHPRMGTRKLHYKIQPLLAIENIEIGRDQLFSLLRSQDLLVKPKKTYRKTTIPGHWRVPNRLPGLLIMQPNQVVVCDITYLEVEIGRFVYLFLIMDLFSRFILGWHVSKSLAASGALQSLQMALPNLSRTQQKTIHHSDHGVQYTSHLYLETLNQHQILPSMGMIGNCYDNIFAERVIGTLKNEYVLDFRFRNIAQVNSAVKEAVYYYNMDRPHLALNMAIPYDVYNGIESSIPNLSIPLMENSYV
jgi:putative transposase